MAAKPAAARNAAFRLALITGVVSDESPAAAEIFGNPGARALQDGTTFRGLTHIDLEDTYAGEDVIESVTQTLMTPRR